MKKDYNRQSATLKDIAQKTGYSINTVSRALRDKDDIGLETREKIKQIAQQMGYINNMIASSLRLGYTNTIAVLLGDVSNPHFAIMMKEIEEHARQLGYFSFLINTNEDDKVEFEAIQSALNKNVDGIIICPTQQSDKNIQYLKETGIPFVLIGRHFKSVKTDYVICNDEMGGYQATRYLLEKGHRNILMLNGPSYISSAEERLLGYRKAHKDCGVPVNEDLIREVGITSGGCASVLNDLLQKRINSTAIFAFSDMIAWDMWSGFYQHHIQVPKEISLIGFDNIQSRLALPFRLNSVSSYKAQMSIAAVDILEQKMRGEQEDTYSTVFIDTKLADGDTVDKPLKAQ